MARAIIRTSVNGPSPNNIQATLGGAAESVGFRRIGTAAYEGSFPRAAKNSGASVGVGVAALRSAQRYDASRVEKYATGCERKDSSSRALAWL
jgi:hypothetical protein